MGANTKYKDSVFSFLFSDPDLLRELYCALEGITLPADIPITINTLQDVLFMDRVNDISFEIGGKLVILIEHQSTINPNMPLRLLMYIVRVYEKIIGDKNIYTSRLLPIPRPEFFILYNGESPYPDEKIGKVREYEKEGYSLEEAIRKAVIYCRDHDILKEFLEKNSSEVINMLMTEWNLDDAKQVWYEDGLMDGKEEIARNALAEGASIEFVQKITGLDMDTIKNSRQAITNCLFP